MKVFQRFEQNLFFYHLITINLIYKATADSDKAAAFHAKCDDAKSTLVLVETDKGKRFGGYSSCSWDGDCIEKKDEEPLEFYTLLTLFVFFM